MRFVCDSCRASYRISDDKVGPKGVKVRCQKCDFVILVRRPEGGPEEGLETQVMSNPLAPLEELAEGEASLSSDTPAPETGDAAAAPQEPAAPPTGPEPGGLDPNALFGDDDEDEIGAIFDSVLNSGSHALPGTEEDPSQLATKTLDVASMAKAMDQSVAADDGEKHELTPALPSNEWYVAIEENQVGPVGIDTLREHWDRGEIGPDSLCWRAGMADWIPLSEVTELQRHLAPKPTKPVIVAPTSGGAEVSTSSALAGAAAEGPSAGGWKPSAASALASLVKDELEVIQRPAPAKKAEPVGSGLLDVPPVASEPTSSPGLAASGLAATAPVASVSLPLSTSAAPEPLSAPAVPAAPVSPYGSIPPYQAMPPPQQKKPVALWIGAAIVAVLLLGGVFFLLGRGSGGVEASPPVAAAQPPPPSAEAPDAKALARAEAEKKAEEEAARKKAEEEALARAEAEKKAEEEAEKKKAEEEAALAEAEEDDDAASKVARRPSRRPSRTSRPSSASRTTTASATAPSRPSSSSSSDPFDDIFGPSDKKPAADNKPSRPATYVPPAPSSVPAELSSSDITQAVVSKRNDIFACVKKAKAADPNLGSGRMVMRWTIQTTGKTTGVSNQTAQYRGSELDKCVTGVVQKLTFPRHRKSGGQQVTFPFTF